MKTIIALLLASCVVSLAQMNADNPVSASDKNAPLDATGQLISAARSGDLETIKLLLKNGADVNAKDTGGGTALSWAAGAGQTDSVRLLLDRGANINVIDSAGNTALMLAAVADHKDVVQLLLDKGADVNPKDKGGGTALMGASVGAGADVVKLLLDKGADINAKSGLGRTALDLAREYGNAAIVQQLQQAGATDSASDKNAPLDATGQLMSAAQSGDLETIKLLLKNGVEINAKDNAGYTALTWAAVEGQTNVVKLLLDKGADFNAKDTKGFTTLMIASEQGQTIVVKLLLDKGADINAKDTNATTALMVAVEGGWGHTNTDVVKLLLDKGADINAKDNEGYTALMWAAGAGKTDVVKLLLDKGADINAKNTSGVTVLMMAAEGVWDHTNTDVVKLLLDKGAEINGKNTYGVTALMWAAGAGKTDVVKLLLDKGADINAKNTSGVTVLMMAAEGVWDHTNTDVVKLLLDKGAEINAKSGLGLTALDFARMNGREAVVQLLQQAGAVVGKPVNSLVASGTNTDSSGYVTNAALLTPFTLTNSAGNIVTDAVLVKMTPNKFLYKTPRGELALLRLDSLSPELQKRFGYDEVSAAAQDAIEEETKTRAMQWQQSQRDLAQQQADLEAQSQAVVATDKSEFEVISVTAKVTEQNSSWWRYGYRLSVRNNGIDHDRQYFDIQFLDADGYVIYTTPVEAAIKPGATEIITGDTLIRLPGAARAANVKAVWNH